MLSFMFCYHHSCDPSAFNASLSVFFKVQIHEMPLVPHLKHTFQVSCTQKLKGICTGDLKNSPVLSGITKPDGKLKYYLYVL